MQNIVWSKKITPQATYVTLFIYAVAEAGNGNIAISGILTDMNTDKHFYMLILSPNGNVIRQQIITSSAITTISRGVHSICRKSADSLIFMYYALDYIINGFSNNGLLIITTDNAGNIGSSILLALSTVNDSYIRFSEIKVSGNKLKMFGDGYSSNCNNNSSNGTFVSMQFDLTLKQVDYFKTYCIPRSFTPSLGYDPIYSWNSVSNISSRIFFLNDGKIAIVRPYTAFLYSSPNTFVPMLIGYFDSSFNLINSGYLQSDRAFKNPVIYDLYISPDEVKHFNIADYNNKYIYYAVADSANEFILQKKMQLPANYSTGNTYGTQIVERGKLTGFNLNSIGTNETYIDYVQIRAEDTAAQCFGTDTSFLSFMPYTINQVPSSPVTIIPATTNAIPLNFSLIDYPMIREDICIIKTICDTIKLHAPDTVCDISQPVLITTYKNPLCNGKVNFFFDTTQVQSFAQINDTTLSLSFNKSYKGKIFAQPAGCDKLKDSIEIFVNAPMPPIDLGKDTFYCPGKNYLFSAYNPNFKTYHWQDGSTDSIYATTRPGTYYVNATDLCGRIYSDTIQIKNSNYLLSAGDDTSICKFQSISLQASTGFSNYRWAPYYNISTTSGRTVNVYPDVTTAYSVSADLFPGCSIKDTVLVLVKECGQQFFVPNAFTPNKDGKNDYFKPIIIGGLNHYEFSIYNRWGQRVFLSTDRNTGWDGTLKGLNQDGNIFVWICKYQFYNQQPETKKGTVILIR